MVAKAIPVIFAEPPSESVLTFGSPHKGNPCQSTKQLQTASQPLCFCFLCWPLLPYPRLQSVKLIRPTLSLAYLILYMSARNLQYLQRKHVNLGLSYAFSFLHDLWNTYLIDLLHFNLFIINITHL